MTDDTAALERAVAVLTARGVAGVLSIPAGTYVITRMINISAPIVLRGAGRDATTLFFPKPLSLVRPGLPTTTISVPAARWSVYWVHAGPWYPFVVEGSCACRASPIAPVPGVSPWCRIPCAGVPNTLKP